MIATIVPGYKIHNKYLELGGCGILLGDESPEILAKEAEVNRKLIEWVKQEEIKLNKKHMEHLNKALEVFGETPYIKIEDNKVIFWIQDGPIKESGKNGIQATDMLEFIKHLFQSLDKEFTSIYNHGTINSIEAAELFQVLRTKDREARSVEGKSKA